MQRPDRSKFPYPWLAHGTPIEGAEARLSVGAAIKLAQLNDEVLQVRQVATENELVGPLGNPEKWMTVSTRRVQDNGHPKIVSSYLGTVGSRYLVVQNEEAFSFFDGALGPDAACIEAAGRVGLYGARVFLIASMPDMLEIVPGDPVERHILLTSTHDGSGPIEAVFIHWRSLSNSGVQPTTKRAGRVRIRHTKNAKTNVKDARKILAKNEEYWTRATNIYRYMAKRDVSVQRAKDFVEHLFPDKVKTDEAGQETRNVTGPIKRAREQIISLFEGACPGADVAGKTDWALLNCVAYFVQHERTNRSKRSGAWEVSTFGVGADLRARANHWLIRDYPK